jgi:hypothetical protein
MAMEGFYYGGYPWRDFGILTAGDLNSAIGIAIQQGSGSGGGSGSIDPGSITNDKLATPWVMVGSTQLILGQTGNNVLSGMSDPTNAGDYATKRYVDTQIAGVSGAGLTVTASKVVPTSGATVAAPSGGAITALLIVPVSSLANLTIVAPPTPSNLEVFELSTTQYIDNLTVLAATGNIISNGAVGSLGAGGGRSWRFWTSDNTWYGRY